MLIHNKDDIPMFFGTPCSLQCLLPFFVKLFTTKDINKNIILESYYSKINFEVKYI